MNQFRNLLFGCFVREMVNMLFGCCLVEESWEICPTAEFYYLVFSWFKFVFLESVPCYLSNSYTKWCFIIYISKERVFHFNTFTAIIDLSQFNNSCLKTPASTLVNLTFQSRSFSLNQLTCHYRRETCTAASVYLADVAFIAI
jgi:hypothetical protein